VNRLAAGFVKSGWSIRQLMRDVFLSDEFKAASSIARSSSSRSS